MTMSPFGTTISHCADEIWDFLAIKGVVDARPGAEYERRILILRAWLGDSYHEVGAGNQNDTETSIKLLEKLIDQAGEQLTPAVGVQLARHLCHLSGGDGRGVYTIMHEPLGDRTTPTQEPA